MVTKGSFLRVSEFITDRPTLCLTSGGHGLCHVGIQFELLQLVAMMMMMMMMMMTVFEYLC
jgi:hypothetical protein